MILVIDNYDSFTDNLARQFGLLGRERRVIRNDAVSPGEIARLAPEAIVLSPGPRAPAQAGVTKAVIERFFRQIPILGVCLGHQAIGEIFGGRTVRSPQPRHGRASPVDHDGSDIFAGLPSPFAAGRYHSLAVELSAESPLRVTARSTDDGVIMALSHPHYPVRGVQFHPESILTEHGLALLGNFMALADAWNRQRQAA